MFKRLIFGLVLLCAVPAMAQTNHAADVALVKSALMLQGADLNGSCGAFRITGRVAFMLRDQGYKLLRKAGGNRAIILPDGSCVDGDHGTGPGYATDYLISVNEGFVGYDLLGDGGGQNAPQWAGPEDAADMVARNRANAAEPFAMGGGGVQPPVEPTPPGSPAVDLEPLKAEIAALKVQIANLTDAMHSYNSNQSAALASLNEEHAALMARVFELEKRIVPQRCVVSLYGVKLGCKLQ